MRLSWLDGRSNVVPRLAAAARCLRVSAGSPLVVGSSLPAVSLPVLEPAAERLHGLVGTGCLA